MRGLELGGRGAILRDDLPRPTVREHESRVRVVRAGVCATDLALSRGYMDFRGVPGHEFVGVALDGPLAGARVVGEINAACGACERCARGDDRHCATRTVLGILGRPGAFAQELALPSRNLRRVPDRVGDDRAVFVEPLAAALDVLTRVDVRGGEPALVVGDGKLGLLCAQALVSAGASVTVCGRHPERVERVTWPMRWTAGGLDAPPPRERFAVAVEASGDPDALAKLVGWMEPRGTIVLKTTSERRSQVDAARLVVDELRVVGSRCGRFEPALAALASGRFEVERLIDARFPLARAVDALEHAARRGVLKVLIDVDGSP